MPTTLEALIILFIFAVPAYLTITVFKARYPILYYRAKQSTLAEATLYAFLGALVIIFTISFLALLGLLAILIRNLLPAGAVPTLNMAGNPVGNLLIIAVPLIIAYYATGVTFSFLIGDIVPHILPKEPPPLWFKALYGIGVRQVRATTWLLVYFKNGDRCLGLVSEVRWLGDENCTMELALEKAFYQLADSKKREEVGRVVLRSDDILWLSPYPG